MSLNLCLPPSADVVVVGAGPAGCAVSALLGRLRHRVLLLDRGAVGRPRLCTHALMPAALPVLAELGVLDQVIAAGAQRWWGVRLTFEGTRIEAALPGQGVAAPYGLSLRRPLLDPILFEAARHTWGVEARLGWSVLAPLTADGAVRGVRVRGPGGAVAQVRARLVVAADGRHSPLLAAAGVPLVRLPNRHVVWIGYAQGIPSEARPYLEAYYARGHSVSLLPADGGLRVAGVVAPSDQWTPATAADGMLRAMARFPELRDRTAIASIVGRPIAVRGLRIGLRAAPPQGIVPLGDAGLNTDPAFGQGIAWALRGARSLAAEVDRRLRLPGDGPLTVPASAAREPLHLPLALGMSLFSQIPPASTLERLIVRSAAQSPRTAALALRLALGLATAAPDGSRRGPGRWLGEALSKR